MSFKVSAETKGKPVCFKISFKEGMHGVIDTLCTRSHQDISLKGLALIGRCNHKDSKVQY